jgi:hypothetical protein
MGFVDAAKAIVCNIVAVALAMTVSAVEALLPGRPDWLERVNELALQLKAIYEKGRMRHEAGPVPDAPAAPRADPDEIDPAPQGDTERLMKAYNHLWQFVHAVRSEGLLLDDRFCERVQREWTVTTLMSYMRSADRSLQDKAGETLDTAAACLAAPGSDSHRSI